MPIIHFEESLSTRDLIQNWWVIGGSVVKNPPASAGDAGLIPGSGRSFGEENGNPLQYFCLGSPMDREAWQATVHGVSKSWMWLRTESKGAMWVFSLYIQFSNSDFSASCFRSDGYGEKTFTSVYLSLWNAWNEMIVIPHVIKSQYFLWQITASQKTFL